MEKVGQKKISNVLGVKQPTVSKYMNGKLRMSIENALLLLEQLEIPIEAWVNPKAYFADPAGYMEQIGVKNDPQPEN